MKHHLIIPTRSAENEPIRTSIPGIGSHGPLHMTYQKLSESCVQERGGRFPAFSTSTAASLTTSILDLSLILKALTISSCGLTWWVIRCSEPDRRIGY